MIIRLLILLLWTSCFSAQAEDVQKPAKNNMLYNRSSQLSVKNINKATTVLRDPVAAIRHKNETTETLKDPTQINENFRQALKNSRVGGSAQTTDNNTLNFPTIRLLGKVYRPKTAHEILTHKKTVAPGQQSSIVLQVDDEVVHLHEGDSSSVIKNNQLYIIEVKAITPYSVKLLLKPSQETLVLH